MDDVSSRCSVYARAPLRPATSHRENRFCAKPRSRCSARSPEKIRLQPGPASSWQSIESMQTALLVPSRSRVCASLLLQGCLCGYSPLIRISGAGFGQALLAPALCVACLYYTLRLVVSAGWRWSLLPLVYWL